jgi:hypothetical protein
MEATTGQLEQTANVNVFLSHNNAGNQLILEGWLGGALVNSASYTVQATPTFQQTQLALYGEFFDHVVLRSTGPHDGGAVFIAVDEFALYYTPPIPMTPFCGGDGLDPGVLTACPCQNVGAPGHGCANSVEPAGALLRGSGAPAQDSVVLLASGMPATASCIYLQGDLPDDVVFGDGVRCSGGNLLRLRTKQNAGGASQFPDATETITLAQRGGVVPGSGVVRFYQTYYRNAAAAFCPPATFNVTNGWQILW